MNKATAFSLYQTSYTQSKTETYQPTITIRKKVQTALLILAALFDWTQSSHCVYVELQLKCATCRSESNCSSGSVCGINSGIWASTPNSQDEAEKCQTSLIICHFSPVYPVFSLLGGDLSNGWDPEAAETTETESGSEAIRYQSVCTHKHTRNTHRHNFYLYFLLNVCVRVFRMYLCCVFRWHWGSRGCVCRGSRGESLAAVRQQQPTSQSGAVGLSALCGENTLGLLLMAEVKRTT